MYPPRVAQILAAAFTLAAVAEANWLGPNRIPVHEKRAGPLDLSVSVNIGTGITSEASSSTVPPTTTTSSTPAAPTSSSTSAPPPPPTTTSTTAAPTTTSKPFTTSSTAKTTSTTSSAEPVTSTSTQVVTKTNSDGSVTSYTTATTVTNTPGLSQNASGTSSMSTQTRNTVIGVVVGVGGAIILGALAFLAWRIWGRRRAAEEADGLTAYGSGYGAADKSEAGSSAGGTMTNRTPFQSTLESYHAPTHVNASSNF